MFAVSASFAADENVTLVEVDDEIAIDDDVLSVEEDTDALSVDDESSEVVSASATVTNATFHNYFDNNGTLLNTVSDDELVFEGNFTGIDVNVVNITKAIKLSGKNAIFNGVSFIISSNNVVIDGFDLTQESSYLFDIEDMTNVTISNNKINFKAINNVDNYVIYANYVDNLKVLNNNITYYSTNSNRKINNVIRVEGDTNKGSSKNILIDNNKFNISIPSIDIRYDNTNFYNALPYTEGIKFIFCEDLKITNNKIDLQYTSKSSGRNTISAIAVNPIFVKGDYDEYEIFLEKLYWNMSKNVLINNNEINAIGHSDIFGISISADNFEVSDNRLNIVANQTYSSGISLLSAASNGKLINNTIVAKAPSDTYGIYTADSFAFWTEDQGSNIENITYEGNDIYCNSTFSCGMELFELYSEISNNIITLDGNYTWGIAQSRAKNSLISSNTIYSLGTNQAEHGSGDPILTDKSAAISIKGSALIENNNIYSTSAGINLVEDGNVVINNNKIVVELNNESIVCCAINAEIDALNITNNNVTFKGKGSYNNAIQISNCKDVIISNNNIVASGFYYTYGIYISGDNFTIKDNNLNITSEVYYACGISVNPGLTEGLLKNNTIFVKAKTAGYGVYSFGYTSGAYSAYSKNIVYDSNIIVVNAYLANPLQLCEDNSYVYNNMILARGNLTCGIFEKVSNNGKATILDNIIITYASEIHGAETGDGYLTNETTSMAISVSGNALIQGNNISSSAIGINYVISGNGKVIGNNIYVATVNDTVNNYAISANGIDSLNFTDNYIIFIGKSNGNAISSALQISNMDDVIVYGNTFDITIPSCDYTYANNPSKGIAFLNVNDLIFKDNNVDLEYNDRIYNESATYGEYDTLAVIEIGDDCNNALINNNNISALGAAYIYGIKVYGKDFNISENTLYIISDVNYANGINPEKGATGTVENNNIYAIGPKASYPIYSGMYGGMGNLDVNYIKNQIYGKAYFVVGLELGGANENVLNNTIIAEGNYTIGIASTSDNNTISDNIIRALGNSIGTQPSGDWTYDIQNTGIVVLKANAIISDNYIEATNGDYAVDLGDTNSTLDDNYITSKKSVGKNAIVNAGSGAVISNVGPSLKTILSAVPFYTIYDAGDVYYVTALDENGDPIKNATIVLNINGTFYNETTDNEGIASFILYLPIGEYDVDISYGGNDTYGPKTAKGYIEVEKRVSDIVAPSSVNVLVTAIKNGYTYTLTLKDDRDNGLANEKVTITFNGKTETVTTDTFGVINYKLVANKVGTQALTITFDSNSNYVASTLTATVKITKEASKLTAAKKTFKAKKKSKKYTVTLKDSKGKAISKVKVKIKVGKKTYSAKTNAKGKATFNLKKLTKKGKYTAKITFAGNAYYNKATQSVKITVKK